MKYVISFIISFLLLTVQAKSQNYFWVAFTDKNNTEFSLSNPEQFLSDRAINRRMVQNIEIDSLDLPPSTIYIDSVLTLDVEFVHASKWLNGVTVKTDIDTLGELMSNWSFVKEVQLTKPALTAKSSKTKFDDVFEKASLIDSGYYGGSVHQVGLLNGQYLHNDNFKGQGMQIAVIDAGFIHADSLQAFDSLWLNDQILGSYDILRLNTDIYSTSGDYHGMSVLSCMGGNVPGQLIGTAPKASYWLIRSEAIGEEYLREEDNWVVAAEFADSVGIDIINSSLGYSEFDDTATSHTYSDMDGKTTRVTQAANIAASRGILVFTSAGNERDDPWFRIIAPADGDLVIGVGAVDKNLQAAYFTSAGPSFDGDIKPNVSAMGYGTVVQRSIGDISKASGTSFSSPVMAGMAACLWQKHPGSSALEIKVAIEASAHQYNAPDSLLGYGIPDMEVASQLLSPQNISSREVSSNWTVYPNPVQSQIVIKYNGNYPLKEIYIEMYSLAGQLVQNWVKPAARRMVLNDIPEQLNGMFLLRLSGPDFSETFKLSKAK